MVDDPVRGGRAAWRHIIDASKAVVRNDRVCDGEADRAGGRLDQDAVARQKAGKVEILRHAVGDGETATRVEHDAVGAGGADPIERYAVYFDVVARASIDGDRVSVRWRGDVGPALALDGDGVADGERAVGAGVERIDLTSHCRCVHGGLEMPAG